MGERAYYTPNKDFLNKSAMTITLDLETWLKVTAHPFPKRSLLVKYELHSGPRGENCDLLQTSIL